MNPVTGAELPELFYTASAEDVDRAATLAKKAFETYSTTSGSVRAAFLRAIANELEAVRPLIAEHVPPRKLAFRKGRANGELGAHDRATPHVCRSC